jgi:hypothetical protein
VVIVVVTFSFSLLYFVLLILWPVMSPLFLVVIITDNKNSTCRQSTSKIKMYHVSSSLFCAPPPPLKGPPFFLKILLYIAYIIIINIKIWVRLFFHV